MKIERRRQWLKPGQKPKLAPEPGSHPEKRMSSVWWTVKGVQYWELLPENKNCNRSGIPRSTKQVKGRNQKVRPKGWNLLFSARLR